MGQTQPAALALNRRVLVIDDEQTVTRFMSLLIGSWGYPVSAVHTLKSVNFDEWTSSDVIIVDLMMPGEDGIQVLTTLARKEVKSSIVMMSGTHAEILTAADKLARQLGLRAIGTLKKPFRSRDLRSLLEETAVARQPSASVRRSSDINVEDLLRGLERREFDAHLQPIVDLSTERPVGFEALARWRSDMFNLVMPDRFISLAARNGLLPLLTRQIADRALQYAATFRKRGLVWKVSINLGAEDMSDITLPEVLAGLVASHGLPPHSLTIELTESSATSNEASMLEILSRMRLKGIGLAIDDFGTSYSGLQRLSVIPFTSLKLDRSFVSDMLTNANALTLVRAAIDLARQLNMSTVAEGIETGAQLDILRRLGCQYGQGYLFARPMEWRDALEWTSRSQE